VKHLKQHWSAQPLSLLLSVLMALPVLALFLFSAPAARAQGLASAQPTWAVLDFANPSGYGGNDVGRLASDSFVVELAKLNRYAVLPRQDLLNGIQTNNLTPPLNLTSIERLGQALGVQAVVAGEIASISFSSDRRQAKVNLVVRVVDPRSGFLLNGALAEGYSNQRPIPVTDEEQLVNEAFGNAAFNAVRQISKFNLPVATILIGRDTQSVTLNKGTRDGLVNGMDMIVTRNGVVTGRIRISSSTNNDADATIVDQGQGIRPEDRATALYHLPDYSINTVTKTFNTASASQVGVDTPSTGARHSAFTGIGGILVALLAAGLLLGAIHGGSSDHSLGGANVSGVHAVSGRAADLGGSISAAPGVGNTSTVSIPFYIPVAVRITADTGNVDPTNFLEFHLYRSDAPLNLNSYANLPIYTATQTTIYNNNNNNNSNTGTNTNGVVIGGILGLSGFGQIPILSQAGHSNLTIFDDFNNKQSVTASKPDPSDSGTLVTLTGAGAGSILSGTTGTAGTNTGTTTNTFVGIGGTGIQFGQRVFYQVEGLYIQPSTYNSGTLGNTNPGTTGNNGQNTNGNGGNNGGGGGGNNGGGGGNNGGGGGNNGGGGGNNGGGGGQNTAGQSTGGTVQQGHSQTFQLTGRRNTNYITYIEPVHPLATSVTGTGANNVNVTVPATRGANDYILQISTDPGFSNSHTYAAAPGAYTATSQNPTNYGVAISTVTGTAVVFNNINLTTDFPTGTSFFYRVGARNSADNGQSGFDNPYVFSDPLNLNISGAAPAFLQSRLRSHNFPGRSRN